MKMEIKLDKEYKISGTMLAMICQADTLEEVVEYVDKVLELNSS
jgi:hypothetical protein